MTQAALSLDIRDPEGRTVDRPNILDRALLRLIVDPRDLPFAHLWLQATFVALPCAIALFLNPGFHPLWGVAYLVMIFAVFTDRYILSLHNTSHRRFWKKEHEWLDHWVQYAIGPLFGETPLTYYAHHVGMHHVEENLPEDLSTTLPFRRDSFLDFMRYFGRFFFGVIIELPYYFYRRKRWRLMRHALGGELVFLAAVAGLFYWNWQAALFVYVLPLCIVRFLMMAGNWAQHAFVDLSATDDPFKSSITCINTRYNRRCYNDGYHIGHHLEPTRHWTEMPGDFRRSIDEYAARGAIVFDGIDYFGIWLLLMLKQKKRLARYYVPLPLGAAPSRDEIVALFESRLLPQPKRLQ